MSWSNAFQRSGRASRVETAGTDAGARAGSGAPVVICTLDAGMAASESTVGHSIRRKGCLASAHIATMKFALPTILDLRRWRSNSKFIRDRLAGEIRMGLGYAVSRVLDTYPDLDPGTVERRLAFGSYAHLKDRVVYLEVPKAACTVVKMVLRDLYASTPLTLYPHQSRQTKRRMFVHARANVPLPSITALDDGAQRELLEDADVL